MKTAYGLRRVILSLSVLILLLLPTYTTAAEGWGTTVKRDPNGCTVHVIVQVGVDGTDADVTAVRNALQNCFNVNCTIPCVRAPACQVDVTVDVQKWSDIPGGDQNQYHKVTMVADDGNPSMATVGTPNGARGTGTWRGGRSAAEYCHEALHLCGLGDKYCGKHKGNLGFTEPACPNPPGPNPCDCEIPAEKNRCTKPCTGSENDIMATLGGSLTCTHIIAIVTAAGLNSCPENPCCPAPPPQCQDGVDNDGDGCMDYPCDTGCESALDNSETGGTCCEGGNAITPIGLSLVAILLLAGGAFVILRRRRAAA